MNTQTYREVCGFREKYGSVDLFPVLMPDGRKIDLSKHDYPYIRLALIYERYYKFNNE